jgi:hypothetical protein
MITDQEIHHVAMGPQRFRCIEYRTPGTIVFVLEDIVMPVTNPFAVPGQAERDQFKKYFCSYMDGLLGEALKSRNMVYTVLNDEAPPVTYGHKIVGVKVATARLPEITLEQLLEGR